MMTQAVNSRQSKHQEMKFLYFVILTSFVVLLFEAHGEEQRSDESELDCDKCCYPDEVRPSAACEVRCDCRLSNRWIRSDIGMSITNFPVTYSYRCRYGYCFNRTTRKCIKKKNTWTTCWKTGSLTRWSESLLKNRNCLTSGTQKNNKKQNRIDKT